MLKIHTVEDCRRDDTAGMPRRCHCADDVYPLHERAAMQIPELVDILGHHDMRRFRISFSTVFHFYPP